MLPLAKSLVCSWNSYSVALAFDSRGLGHGWPKACVTSGRCFRDSNLRSPLFWRDLEALAAGRCRVSSAGLCSQRQLLVGLLCEASRSLLRRHAVVSQAGRNPDRRPLGTSWQSPPTADRSQKEARPADVQRGLLWQTAPAAFGLECCFHD